MTGHADEDRRRTEDPEGYWAEQASTVSWIRKPRVVREVEGMSSARWYSDGALNLCYNALDRHVVTGHADSVALVHESPGSGVRRSMTYAELLERVAAFAGVLRTLGVQKGDRVVVVLPPVPELVVAMLACARLGAVHCVVAADVDADDLAARVDAVRPGVIVTASCVVGRDGHVTLKPVVDRALELAEHQPGACIVKQRREEPAELVEPRDVDWDVMARAGATAPAECVTVESTDPAYVVPASGAAHELRDSGGLAVATAWVLPHVLDVHAGDTWWAAVDPASETGHVLGVYAPLLSGVTTLLVEDVPGVMPDPQTFAGLVAECGVTTPLVPSATVRSLREAGPDDPEARTVSSLRGVIVVGEALDPDTSRWFADWLAVPEPATWADALEGWPGPPLA